MPIDEPNAPPGDDADETLPDDDETDIPDDQLHIATDDVKDDKATYFYEVSAGWLCFAATVSCVGKPRRSNSTYTQCEFDVLAHTIADARRVFVFQFL